MRVQRLFADEAGDSHWMDIEVGLEERVFAPPAQNIEISKSDDVRTLLFLRLRAGWNEPIHPTPVTQKLICVAGAVEVTASDGEARVIAQGDVWHMEDKTGNGHHTRVIGSEDFEAVIVQYD